MGTLREHLAGKLSNPEFRAGYETWCEACVGTMEVIGRIHAAGANVAELARQIGIEPQRIAAFMDAERCEYEVMAKLCVHFGLMPPEGCARKRPV